MKIALLPALLALFVCLLIASLLPAQELGAQTATAPAPFTVQERVRYYFQSTFLPRAALGPVTGAALTQWVTDNPPEWGEGFAGYGRRVLSGYGRQTIANTVALGIGFVAHDDPRHYPTGEHEIWKRALYAARESVIVRSSSGGLMPAYSRIAGDYAAGFISNAWYPSPYSNVHRALERGSTALASDIIWQELREFWPDASRKLRRH